MHTIYYFSSPDISFQLPISILIVLKDGMIKKKRLYCIILYIFVFWVDIFLFLSAQSIHVHISRL